MNTKKLNTKQGLKAKKEIISFWKKQTINAGDLIAIDSLFVLLGISDPGIKYCTFLKMTLEVDEIPLLAKYSVHNTGYLSPSKNPKNKGETIRYLLFSSPEELEEYDFPTGSVFLYRLIIQVVANGEIQSFAFINGLSTNDDFANNYSPKMIKIDDVLETMDKHNSP
jgi:hypothetical protein